ncbi:MAG: endolytic transglycosylase MltG, partial [Myxococcaceae bacterium]
GAWFWLSNQKLDEFVKTPFGNGNVTVDVQAKGPLALGQLLQENNVVSDAELFAKYLRRDKLMPKMKAGEYEFALPMTPAQVAEKIASGQVKTYKFTVPEGLRTDEILPILASSELHLKIEKLSQLVEDRAFLKKIGVPADRIEGFLFPDTYTFTKGANEEAVLQKMVARTLEEYKKADAHRKPGNKLDLLQSITLASIVEKETGAPEERPRISCLFHNRLRLGMKLQTDPTVLYAMMLLRGSFVKNITRQDLITEHPYNTYTMKGLPPGPIANPGAAAIQASLNPMECDDLFFVSMNNGHHAFCPDLKCHNAAVQKWQVEYFHHKG